MARGTRSLLRLTVPSPRAWVTGQLGPQLTLELAGAPHPGFDELLEDATNAALDALIVRGGGPAWDAAAFAALREQVRGEIRPTTLEVLVALSRILQAARSVRDAMDRLPTGAGFGAARQDVARQLGRLVYAGMLTATGLQRLADVERYLLAAAQRVERLPRQLRADTEHMAVIHQLETEATGRADLRWLIEELRVSQLAPGPLVRPGATVRRVREALAAGR